jgi:hypothetical protein
MAMVASAALLRVPTCSPVIVAIASQIEAAKNPHWVQSTFKVSSAGGSLRRPNLEEMFTCASYASRLRFHPNNRKLNGPSALFGKQFNSSPFLYSICFVGDLVTMDNY